MSTTEGRPADLRAIDPDASAFGVRDVAPLPSPASQTYYDQPLLKRPHWERDVVTYLWLGGIMGGSGILVALADEDGEDAALSRSARYVAFVLASVNPLILIGHLGRPERFLHMMRIWKFKSVMSMGVWGLIGFSLPASAAAFAQASRDGLPVVPAALRPLGRLVPRVLTDPLAALLGAFIAGYTGVLLSATAIPVWAIGKRHIPAFCVCSGLAGGCALNGALLALTGGSPHTLRKLERLETVAGLAELGLLLHFRRHAGATGKPMFGGATGRRIVGLTMIGGIAIPALLSLLPEHRAKTLVAAALTLAGGFTLRDGLITAGKDSADDPRMASRQPE